MVELGNLVSGQSIMPLDAVIDSITTSHPVVRMYNNEIRSMDEAAKGAKSWMPPEVSTGLWMVPYNPNMWKRDDMGGTGMGQYMIGGATNVPEQKETKCRCSLYECHVISRKRKKECNTE